jgi:hypothetical protein
LEAAVNLSRRSLFVLVAISLMAAGCEDRDPAGLEISGATVDPVIFDDALNPDVYYQPFFQTNPYTMTVDSVHAWNGFAQDGARSLRFNVAPQGSSLGLFSGGVITSGGKRDLSPFNALTFYARSDANIAIDIMGFGNDNTGNSLYEAGRGNISLTNEWQYFLVPIPAPWKLLGERGMLTFAEGIEEAYPQGYNIWMDEIRYDQVDGIEVFRVSMSSISREYFIGSVVIPENTRTVFQYDGGFIPVSHFPNYFDFTSSDPSVAQVDRGSQITVMGEGQARVTAKLGDEDVLGTIAVTGLPRPQIPADPPTIDASRVISMFSDVYQDVPVDTWRAPWTPGPVTLEEYAINGDNTKLYSALSYVGILMEENPIDASAMTNFHLDVYAPSGTDFRAKLVSFPSGGPPGVETAELRLTPSTTPAFVSGGWSSLDIPLSDFVLGEGWDWSSIAQLVLVTTDAQLVLVDNVYFADPIAVPNQSIPMTSLKRRYR